MAAQIVDKNIDKVKCLHKEAYKYISDALANDESNGPTAVSIDLYKKGIARLNQGISITLVGNGERVEKYKRLQDKMKDNISMANERLKQLNLNSEKNAAKPNAAKLPRTPSSSSQQPSLNKSSRVSCQPAGPQRLPSAEKPVVDRIKNVDKSLANMILNEVLDKSPPISFDDIAGNEAAKVALQEMVIYPTRRPDLFTGIRSPCRGLLLFGPPGNGKTLLAKAVAHESGCVFFNISAATLVSKWVGESEKLVRALFAMARELQPCIIFLDEVDSLLGARKAEDKESSRRLLTQFLQEFDGVASGTDERLVVIAATNRPQDLDEAALRRFPKRLLIQMPDETMRLEMLRMLLHDLHNSLSDREMQSIATMTENYSASDLKHLAKDAAMGPLRDVPRDKLLTMDKSAIRAVRLEDFKEAMNRVRPSVTPQGLKVYQEWAEKYGQFA